MRPAIVSAERRFRIMSRLGAEQFVQELEQPVSEPPRWLETGLPRQPLRPAPWRLVAVLLILCLLPRAWRAVQLDVPCPDGTFYIQVASALERGDYAAAFRQMPINIYPFALAGMHRLGLDWPLAGKLWGLTLATLTILPLFGWLRRQTDDRVATIAALLYAAHPKFIEWTPELVRDATFWFLASLSLYFGFRAVTEVRIRCFLAAGLALTLAVHTRFEGWFLFIPIVLWSGWRWLALTQQRGRLLAGLVGCLGVCPALIGGAQLVWPGDSASQHWGSMNRVVYVQNWLKSLVATPNADRSAPPRPAPQAANSPAAAPAAIASSTLVPAAGAIEPGMANSAALVPAKAATSTPPLSGQDAAGAAESKQWAEAHPHLTSAGAFELLPARIALGRLFRTLMRGLDAVFGVCLLIGWWNWRYVWIRRDYFPLFCFTMAIILGMWIHLSQVYGSSSRYALPLALTAMPCSAVGLLTVCRGVRWLANWFTGRKAALASVFAAVMLLVTMEGWIDALTTQEPGRHREAALGQWMKDEYGAERRVAFAGNLSLVSYFAQCQGFSVPFYGPPPSVAGWLRDTNPDLLVIHRKEFPPGAIDVLVGEGGRLGWQSVAAERLPANCRSKEFIVLARPEHTASQSQSGAFDSGLKR